MIEYEPDLEDELIETIETLLSLISEDRLHHNDEWKLRDAKDLLKKIQNG